MANKLNNMQPELTRRQKDKLLFCIGLEFLEYHRTTFQYDLIREVKFQFNNFFSHFKNLRNTLIGNMTPQAKEFLDDVGANFWDMVHELERSKQKKQIVSLMKFYNDCENPDELLALISEYHKSGNKTEFYALGVSYNAGELVVADEAEYNKLLTLNNK